MVTGFDTTTSGDKTLTISYNGVTINCEYTVVEECMAVTIETVYIESMDKSYEIGDSYKGINVKVELSDGTYRIVEIDFNNIEGFDTTTIGKKEITVNYVDFVLKTFIFVTFSDDNLSDENVKYLYAISQSIMEGKAPTDLDTSYFDQEYASIEDVSKEEMDDAREQLLSYGLTNDQVAEIKKIDKKFGKHFNFAYGKIKNYKGNETLNEIYDYITLDNIKEIKEVVATLLTLVKVEQLDSLFNNSSTIYCSYNYATMVDDKLEYAMMTIEEYLENFSNVSNIDKVNVDDHKDNTEVPYALLLAIANNFFDMKDEDFYDLCKIGFKGVLIAAQIGEYEITKEEVYKVINITNEYQYSLKENGLLKECLSTIINLYKSTTGNDIKDYAETDEIIGLFEFIYDNYDYLYKTLKNLTVDDCEYIKELILHVQGDSLEQTLPVIVVLSKALNKTLEEVKTQLTLKEKIKHYIEFFGGEKEYFDEILEYVENISKFDEANLTNANIEYIKNFISFGSESSVNKDFISAYSDQTLVFKYGITETDLYKLLNANLTVEFYSYNAKYQSYESTAITLNSTNTKITLNKGANTYTINVKGVEYTGYYILASSDELTAYIDNNYLQNLTNYLFIVDKGDNKLYDYCYYKIERNYLDAYNNVESTLSRIRYTYLYDDRLEIYYYANYSYYDIIVDSKTTGLKNGMIILEGMLSEELYIPVQFLVVDLDNPIYSGVNNCYCNGTVIEDENGEYTFYLWPSLKEYNFNFQVIFNYGVNTFYVNAPSKEVTVTGLDLSVYGEQNVTINCNDFSFNIKVCVLTEEERDTPISIIYLGEDVDDEIIDYYNICLKEIPVINENSSFAIRTLGCNYDLLFTYENLKDKLELLTGKEVVIKFETDFIDDSKVILETFIGYVNIYDKDTNDLLYTFEYEYQLIDPLHYYDLNNYVYAYSPSSSTMVDSFDEVDVEFILNCCNKYMLSYKYHSGSIYMTASEVYDYILSIDASFELIDEYSCDEYHRYSLYYNFNSSNQKKQYYLFNITVYNEEYALKVMSLYICNSNELPVIVDEIDETIIIDYLKKYYYLSVIHPAYEEVLTGDDMLNILSECKFNFEYDLKRGVMVVQYTYDEFEGEFYIPYVISLADYHMSSNYHLYATDETLDLVELLKNYMINNYTHCDYYYYDYKFSYLIKNYTYYIRVYDDDYNLLSIDIDDFINHLSLVENATLTVGQTTLVNYKYRDMVFGVNVECRTLQDLDAYTDFYFSAPTYVKSGDNLTIDELIEQTSIRTYEIYGEWYLTKHEREILIKDVWKMSIVDNALYADGEYFIDIDVVDESEKDAVKYFSINKENSSTSYNFYRGLSNTMDIIYNSILIIDLSTNSETKTLVLRSEINDFLDTCTITYDEYDSYIYVTITNGDCTQSFTIYN